MKLIFGPKLFPEALQNRYCNPNSSTFSEESWNYLGATTVLIDLWLGKCRDDNRWGSGDRPLDSVSHSLVGILGILLERRYYSL